MADIRKMPTPAENPDLYDDQDVSAGEPSALVAQYEAPDYMKKRQAEYAAKRAAARSKKE